MTPEDPITVWLDYLKPFSTGLVVAPNVLRDLGLIAPPQRATDTAEAEEVIEQDSERPALPYPWAFATDVLRWPGRHVAGSPGGPEIPESLRVRLPEYGTTLAPTWAVRDTNVRDLDAYQLLVCLLGPGIDPDGRGTLEGWEATPHQRLERLLRETEVPAGLLISDDMIRLIYAPKGETSGWLGFPIRSLATVQGRPMLGGLKLMLDDGALFTNDDARRLPGLLRASREAQAGVSTELAGQVLGALHDLLRGLDAADPEMVRGLVRVRPEHLYEGLLTVLMRLVFVLYAEDRDLLPARTDAPARDLYERSYSMRGLYHRLLEDAALNLDTMDERRGGWGQMLALFRLIHGGHGSGFVRAKGGKLFDPDAFLFLEGRSTADDPARVLPISDGCILRILEGLMTLQARGGARERISYRALDVEQIGSVYETVMGFTAVSASGPVLAVKGGKNNRTPIYLDLAELVELKGDARLMTIKDAGRNALSASQAKAVKDATSVVDLAAALDGIVDERGSPKRAIQAAGVPLLQPTDERRRTGSHYTPRGLTEPIVRYALEPVFARIGTGARPEAVLDLKVCDPAMGSGAFLVEACRQLGSRLVEAWSRHGVAPQLPPDEDIDLHARRIVASRCLYGVDRNPMAVDLARLSLWLTTLAREHEFSFLDHALKNGDSLVGLSRREIQAVHWDSSKASLPLFKTLVEETVRKAFVGRELIRNAADDVPLAVQNEHHHRVEVEVEPARVVGDAIIAAYFAADKSREREAERAKTESWITGSPGGNWNHLRATSAAFCLRQGWRPFHWEVEFPEVFARDNPGFNVVVGNPPFLSGSRTSQIYGASYFQMLLERFPGAKHQCDIVAFFFRKAFDLLQSGGTFGLIATKTIAQGDTRESSVGKIVEFGGCIYRVSKRLVWPGEASVIVSIVHTRKGPTEPIIYNDRPVGRISTYLVPDGADNTPRPLKKNPFFSKGSQPYGQGFVFDDDDARANPTSILEAIRNSPDFRYVHPMFGGIDINQKPLLVADKWIIDVSEVTSEAELDSIPLLRDILIAKVKPERDKLPDNANNRPLKKRWWAYQAHRPELYKRLRDRSTCLVHAEVSPHLAFSIAKTGPTFIKTVIVIDAEGFSTFAVLQSRVHEIWARYFSSSLEDRLRYTPSDCFETFPLPIALDNQPSLEAAGRLYYDQRAKAMTEAGDGLTKIYNRFHDPVGSPSSIQALRERHDEMDRAVLRAYGWDDLADALQPISLTAETEDDHVYRGRYFWSASDRDRVFARLLTLNAERAAAERGDDYLSEFGSRVRLIGETAT